MWRAGERGPDLATHHGLRRRDEALARDRLFDRQDGGERLIVDLDQPCGRPRLIERARGDGRDRLAFIFDDVGGQCRLVTLGFRQGGSPGYGLRRQLIDEHRVAKADLARGEYKSLQTDRVILKLGPMQEVEIVRRIYRLFVVQLKTEGEIATILNVECIPNEFGRPWTRGTIHQILTNEKYVAWKMIKFDEEEREEFLKKREKYLIY